MTWPAGLCDWPGRETTAGYARRRPVEPPEDPGSIPGTSTMGSWRKTRTLVGEKARPRAQRGASLRDSGLHGSVAAGRVAAGCVCGTCVRVAACVARACRSCVTADPNGRLPPVGCGRVLAVSSQLDVGALWPYDHGDDIPFSAPGTRFGRVIRTLSGAGRAFQGTILGRPDGRSSTGRVIRASLRPSAHGPTRADSRRAGVDDP
jgi:hypothetical protein